MSHCRNGIILEDERRERERMNEKKNIHYCQCSSFNNTDVRSFQANKNEVIKILRQRSISSTSLVLSDDDEQHLFSQGNSTRTSRLSSYSKRHFDFFDPHHSVFSRNSYYDDMHCTHPWMRRSFSPCSGIPVLALRRTRSYSSRLDELAQPKIKRERLIRQGKSLELTQSFISLSLLIRILR